jgi:hypothetical protein
MSNQGVSARPLAIGITNVTIPKGQHKGNNTIEVKKASAGVQVTVKNGQKEIFNSNRSCGTTHGAALRDADGDNVPDLILDTGKKGDKTDDKFFNFVTGKISEVSCRVNNGDFSNPFK